MKTLSLLVILFSTSCAYAYYPTSNVFTNPSFPSFDYSNTTIIRHHDGTTTYIQPNGPSGGCIRYPNGNVDYYSR